MRFYLFFLCCAILPSAFAQELSTFAEKTAQHQQIAGTQVWMQLPPGFELSTRVRGYSRADDPLSIFVITEMPAAYKDLVQAIQPEQLQNMTFTSVQHGTLHGDSATIVSTEQIYNEIFFKKYILCTGDSANTIIINCVFPRDSAALGEKMKAALYTVIVEKKSQAERRQLLDYSIDEKESGLQFAGVVGNGLLFNTDGIIANMHKAKSMFVSDKSALMGPVLDKEEFCTERVHTVVKGQKVTLKGKPKAISMDGLKGYELQATSKDEEKKQTDSIYQVILFTPDAGYYIFVGIHYNDSKGDISIFKNMLKSFKRK